MKAIASPALAEPPTAGAALPAASTPEADQEPPSSDVPLLRAVHAVPRAGMRAEPPRADHGAQSFRTRHYPHISDQTWADWRWQLANRLTTAEDFARVLRLSPGETRALSGACGPLPAAITPYYASLLDPANPAQPLRRTMVPTPAETIVLAHEADDPLGEDHDSPVDGLVHRYPDRVLFLATQACAAYCRYCTRSRLVGDTGGAPRHWDAAIAYIEAHPEVRDVLISGGDPLTLPDALLQRLLTRLRAIPHVEILRIGTKVPMVLPQRVTPALARLLARFHPLFISVHATHPDELTPETARALTRLADAGIPLGSQTVLLAGVNDDPATMKRLYHGLLKLRVRPYYLYQCDQVRGTAHFRTEMEKGLTIIRSLRGHTSGYAIPTYVVDLPHGGGKTPVCPDSVLTRDASSITYHSYDGRTVRVHDPAPGDAALLAADGGLPQ